MVRITRSGAPLRGAAGYPVEAAEKLRMLPRLRSIRRSLAGSRATSETSERAEQPRAYSARCMPDYSSLCMYLMCCSCRPIRSVRHRDSLLRHERSYHSMLPLEDFAVLECDHHRRLGLHLLNVVKILRVCLIRRRGALLLRGALYGAAPSCLSFRWNDGRINLRLGESTGFLSTLEAAIPTRGIQGTRGKRQG